MTMLRDMLKRHEGLRNKPYRCTAGRLTIGYGRNLQDLGISDREAEFLLDNDIERVIREATVAFPWVRYLDPVRQAVVLDMLFNLGLDRLFGFRKFLAALERGDYEQAASEMRDSAWFHQVGDRSRELVDLMRKG